MTRQQLDEQPFDPAQITMQILAVAAEVEKKIADQLPRPVIGRLTAPIDFEKRMRQMLRAPQTRLIGGASDRVNRVVFEQPKLVGSCGIQIFLARRFLLPNECCSKINPA